MRREIDARFVIAAVAVVLIVIGVVAWKTFGGGTGQLSAAQAGLGKPMHPGEIPGKRPAVGQAPAGSPAGR